MALVRNISDGPRGAYLGAVLVWANPGKVVEADDFAPEWFELAVEAEDEANAISEAPELAKMTVEQLKAFAAANAIDLGDAVKKADILSAIELAVEAEANQ